MNGRLFERLIELWGDHLTRIDVHFAVAEGELFIAVFPSGRVFNNEGAFVVHWLEGEGARLKVISVFAVTMGSDHSESRNVCVD